MTAKDHFSAGRLQAAIDAQLQDVRAAQLDAGKRTFLFELLAFAGELERAGQQLTVLGQESNEHGWAATVYQNLLTAEQMRRKVFAGQAKPEVFLDPPDFIAARWHALEHLSRGTPEATAAGLAKLAESDAAAPLIRGTLNDAAVAGLRDADDLLAPILEFMVLRDYVWVPWSQIVELTVEAPKHPRDLLWATASVILNNGEERRGYLPAIYPGSYAAADDSIKLGRITDWLVPEGAGPVRGLGQHLLIAGEADFGLLDVRHFVSAP